MVGCRKVHLRLYDKETPVHSQNYSTKVVLETVAQQQGSIAYLKHRFPDINYQNSTAIGQHAPCTRILQISSYINIK